jgi:hypothetical protein
MIQAGGNIFRSDSNRLINSIRNTEEFPQHRRDMCEKCDKTDCSNFRGISLLPTTNKILSNIFLSRLNPYEDEIIGEHRCGFRRDRSTTDQIYCIRQILEKRREYNGRVPQLLLDFKKAYDSVRREILCNIPIEFVDP